MKLRPMRDSGKKETTKNTWRSVRNLRRYLSPSMCHNLGCVCAGTKKHFRTKRRTEGDKISNVWTRSFPTREWIGMHHRGGEVSMPRLGAGGTCCHGRMVGAYCLPAKKRSDQSAHRCRTPHNRLQVRSKLLRLALAALNNHGFRNHILGVQNQVSVYAINQSMHRHMRHTAHTCMCTNKHDLFYTFNCTCLYL
jgi:hypothetical protein